MSRSNNTEIVNPCARFFEWNGDKGLLRYYDKELPHPTDKDKKGANVEVGLPFTFLVLDTLSTISGFSDADNSGFWSNEIRNIKTDILVVRNKKGKVFTGTYDQLKAANISGVKYAQSVYIAFKNENKELVIGNIKMVGSSLGAWIDYRAKHKIYEGAISIKGTLHGKKGKTEYEMPVFSSTSVSEDTDKVAKDLDIELQEYLTAYFKRGTESKSEEEQIKEIINESHKDTFGSPPNDLFVDEPPIEEGYVVESQKQRVMEENAKKNQQTEESDLPF